MSYPTRSHTTEVYPIKDTDDPILKSLRQNIVSERRQSDLSESQNYMRVPALGRLRCVRDRDGILMLLAIYAYWVYGMWSSYYVVLEPHYLDGRVHEWFLYYHFATAALCLMALVRSSTMNPGALPTVDATFADTHKWEVCPTCGKYRPHRAHHCRRCRQCVIRMDHHCPWINNCVGEGNHHVFSLLLFYAFLFSFNTFIAVMMHFWYWPKCVSCDKEAFLIKHGIWFSYLTTLMSATMAFFMFMQFMTHHFNLLLNRTTLDNMRPGDIENIDYSVLKIRATCSAYRDHCGTWKVYLWPWPCRRRKSTLMTNMMYA